MDNGELLYNAIKVCFLLCTLGDCEPLQSALEGCHSEFCIIILQMFPCLSPIFLNCWRSARDTARLLCTLCFCCPFLWGLIEVFHIDPSPWWRCEPGRASLNVGLHFHLWGSHSWHHHLSPEVTYEAVCISAEALNCRPLSFKFSAPWVYCL